MKKTFVFFLFIFIFFGISTKIQAATSNKCSLIDAKQSTLSEYAKARKFNVAGQINVCINGDQSKALKDCETIIKEYPGMTLQYQDTWRVTEKEKGKYDFTNFDKAINFAKKNDIKLHFFHLIWTNSGTNKYVPTWLFKQTDKQSEKQSDAICGSWTKQELLNIMKEHIQNTIQHAGDTVSFWNVVNEAFNSTGYIKDCFSKIIGAPEYIDKAFIYARQASPNGILVLNDAFGRDLMDEAEVNVFFNYVKDAKRRGIPIDAVGLENHLLATSGKQFSSEYLEDLRIFFQKAKDANVKVIISEMDVYQAGHSQEEVAKVYKNVVAMCLEYSNCISFGTWGISDLNSWARNPNYANLSNAKPLLFDESYKRKPAYYGVMDAIRENTTRECVNNEIPGIKEVTYSTIDNIKLKLDICSPENQTTKLPAVVYIHGGGFSSGDKSSGTNAYCDFFRKNNLIFVSVNYRLSSQAKYPAGFDDVQYAIRWLRKNADTYNIDSTKIASMGASAGATFASLLGVRDTANTSRGLSEYSSKVKTVVSISGVQDFNGPLGTWKPLVSYFQNDKEKIYDASTINHLTSDDASFLLIHGTKDAIVPIEQTTNFSKKLNDLDIKNEFISYSGGHGFGGISATKIKEIKDSIIKFLKETLNTPTPTPPTPPVPPTPPTPPIPPNTTPNINTSFWDNFEGQSLNSKRWKVYGNDSSVKVQEGNRDNLSIVVKKGQTNFKPKSGGVVFNTGIPKDSDFRSSITIYKPTITDGRGEVASGISFSPVSGKEEDGVKVFWKVNNSTLSRLVMTYRNNKGEIVELGKVDIKESVIQIRLVRVGTEYRGMYKLGLNDDLPWKVIASSKDITSVGAGYIRYYATNLGTESNYPGLKSRIDTSSIGWFDSALPEKEIINDTFSGLVVNRKKWSYHNEKGTKTTIGFGSNLVESISKGSIDKKARTNYITTKKTITKGKTFRVSSQILKPLVKGDGIGNAGIEYFTTNNNDKEKISITWSSGNNTNKIICIIQDSQGKEVFNQSINLNKDTNKIVVVIARNEDGYTTMFKEKISDDEPFIKITEKILLQNANDGVIRLITTNVGYDNKYPSVKGRFDTFNLGYYK